MTSTRTTSTTAIVSNRAHGYDRKGSAIINAEDWIAVRPSGAFVSAMLDLAKGDTSNPPTQQMRTRVTLRLWDIYRPRLRLVYRLISGSRQNPPRRPIPRLPRRLRALQRRQADSHRPRKLR